MCGINQRASKKEDQTTIDRWITFISDRTETLYLGDLREGNMGLDNVVKWIVAGALILVGLYACLKFLDNYQQTSGTGSSAPRRSSGSPSPPVEPVSVSLCLVVPSHVVSGASEINPGQTGQRIQRETIERLIDNASYFLCTEYDVNQYEQRLSFLLNVDIPSDSQREVYVSIDISDGREMLGKRVPYALKSNLKPEATFTVRKISLLRDLSGLDQFNRI